MTIDTILEDLYLVDPELKKHEQDLVKIINKLLESRPSTKFDEKFAEKLRQELLSEINFLKKEQKNQLSFREFIATPFMKKFAFGFAGIAVITIALASSLNLFSRLTKTNNLSFEEIIKPTNENAFGKLSMNSEQTTMPNTAGIEAERTLGLGEYSKISFDRQISSLPAPYFRNYKYIYTGDDFEITENKMPVYKRIKDNKPSEAFANIVSNNQISEIDLSKFDNSKLINFNIEEDKEFGYSIYFDLKENIISINPMWQKWPRPEEACKDQSCFDALRLKINDVPNDNELIKIADNFVKSYKIDTTHYGKAEVLNYWRENYDQSDDKSQAYIPESIPVVYPLILNNQEVYNQGGDKYGLNAEIDIRNKKISGIRNIMPYNFQSSDYAIEGNQEKLIELAENGGLRQIYNNPDAEKSIKIEIGTPKTILVSYYKYDEDKQTNEELFIPALMFPIERNPEIDYYYERSIIVPLVSDIINDLDKPRLTPYPEPLLMRSETKEIQTETNIINND